MSDELLDRIKLLERQVVSLTDALGREDNDGGIRLDEPLEERMAKVHELLKPIKPLLDDDLVNDILINGPKSVYVESFGKLQRTNYTFPSDDDLYAIAKAIAKSVGREVSSRRPLLDARLPDGSRVNVAVMPLAVDGTTISIRKFAKRSITLDIMAECENMSTEMAEFLKVVAATRMNVIISGGTGSGKTTLLNAISQFIHADERIVTIEDAAELRLQQPHVVRLETRPVVNNRREDEISMRHLMKNALRMRPDRILVGEVRAAEAFDMMQAMNTGHEGSITTVHANHPRDALSRLENMISMANLNLPTQAIRAQIASAVHLIIQISRMRDGHRRVTSISEVVGMEQDIITMQDLFTYQVKGEMKDGKLMGEFKWSGIMPRMLRRASYYGHGESLAKALGVKLQK